MTTEKTLKTKVSIQPLADRVALRPMEETEQQRGGVLIPAMVKETPQRGEVVAVGRGRYEKGVRVPHASNVRRAVLTRADRRSFVILYDLPEIDVRSEGVVDGIDVENQGIGRNLRAMGKPRCEVGHEQLCRSEIALPDPVRGNELAVLHEGPIKSPADAVKASIISQYRTEGIE